jgi:hypothetical protein
MLIFKKTKNTVVVETRSIVPLAVCIVCSVMLALACIIAYSNYTHTEVDSHPIFGVSLTCLFFFVIAFLWKK